MTRFPKTESLTVEFKTSFNEDVVETLVAFANAKGGTVYVGVSDKGKPQGITIGKETIQNWINEIKNKTGPQIIPEAEVLVINNKEIVSFYIQEYPIKPVATRGKYFKRVGNSNHFLSATEVANMHLQTVNSSWDYYPRPNKTLADISLAKVEKAMKIMRKRNDNFEFETPAEFLIKNELLLPDNRISNGCFLMFSEGENLYTTIQMGHFQDEITIKDDVTNFDDILTQVDEVMAFVRKHINKELIITDKQVENIQRWQYPLDAIRKIVLNMIIHRDYTSASNSIVKIFSDHILFFNPGALPDTITIEQLLGNQYISTPRNRQIAKTVKEMGWIEHYGTGVRRVRKMFVDYGLEEPKYEVLSGGLAVTVYGLVFENESIGNVTESLEKDVTDSVTDNIENVTDSVTANVTDRTKKILHLIRENNQIAASEIAKYMKVSKRTVLRDIEKLKQDNTLERIGKGKESYWKINVPEEVINEDADGVIEQVDDTIGIQVSDTVSDTVSGTVSDTVVKLLTVLSDETLKPSDIREKMRLKHRTFFLNNYIQPALQLGLIEMTIPDKPNSRLQKYRLTEKGIEIKEKLK
jgi:ATP-dependent DNA helicase RecG